MNTSSTYPTAIYMAGIDTYSCYGPDSKVAPVWQQFQKAIKEAEELGATHYAHTFWPGSIQTLHFFKDDVPKTASTLDSLKNKPEAQTPPSPCETCGK